MNDVLILPEPNKTLHLRAKRMGMRDVVADGPLAEIPFDRALIVSPGIEIPWHLVEYGLHFVERWDAAAPLWRYGVLAEDLGSKEERRRTEAMVRDLRVLLYAHELLFVRDSPDGRALLDAWEMERANDGEPRLAFLRALYQVKPIFCALPTTWLGSAVRHGRQAITRSERRALGRRGKQQPVANPLVRVEIKPGVYVRCHPGHEQEILDRFCNTSRGGD